MNLGRDTQCGTKRAYRRRRDARRAMRQTQTVYGQREGFRFHVYECFFCRRWHVGHQPLDMAPLPGRQR